MFVYTGELVEVGDVLRKQIQEKDLLKEREERLKTELEVGLVIHSFCYQNQCTTFIPATKD